MKTLILMNGNSVLIDTNIVIEIFSGDKNIAKKLSKFDRVYLPSTVLGELFYGALLSNKQKQRLEEIKSFAENCIVVSCDETTALYYARIKSALKVSGKPIPENDLWIAAIAMQLNLELATNDKHFHNIDTIKKIQL